jgi:hypothetical protein
LQVHRETGRKKHIKYNEGQWFAVPLGHGGYAVGVIVRGQYKTKGGLGYFFGPKRDTLPMDADTQYLHPADAVLITWFGDLGIIEGEWPLLHSTRPFHREAWPVPKFGRVDSLNPEVGWLVEYAQDALGMGDVIRETRCRVQDLVGLPRDASANAGAVEVLLTKLLDVTNIDRRS